MFFVFSPYNDSEFTSLCKFNVTLASSCIPIARIINKSLATDDETMVSINFVVHTFKGYEKLLNSRIASLCKIELERSLSNRKTAENIID